MVSKGKLADLMLNVLCKSISGHYMLEVHEFNENVDITIVKASGTPVLGKVCCASLTM